MIFSVLNSLFLPICVLLLAACLGRIDRSQSLEKDVARVSKLLRNCVYAMHVMLATLTAAYAVKICENDDSEDMAADAAGNASPLPDCPKDLKKAQHLLEGPIHRQFSRLVYREEITVLSKERTSKINGHAIETQTKTELHAQVKALNGEFSSFRDDAVKTYSMCEVASEALKDSRGEDEDEQI